MLTIGDLPIRKSASGAALLPPLSFDACPCGQRKPMGVLLGMRSGARPRLEGQWYCRRACLQAALLERVRRDFPENAPHVSRLRHRVPLGLLLQARGVVSAEQLKHALQRKHATGLRIGQILTEEFGVREEQITGAIAAQWGLPVLHLPETVSMHLSHLAPGRFFTATGCLPVERRQNRLLLACAEGADPGIAFALERMHGVHVDFGVVSSTCFDRWRGVPQDGQLPLQTICCGTRKEMAIHATSLLLKLQPVESRVVRMGRWWWLRVWMEQHALSVEGAGAETLDVIYSMDNDTREDLPALPPLTLS